VRLRAFISECISFPHFVNSCLNVQGSTTHFQQHLQPSFDKQVGMLPASFEAKLKRSPFAQQEAKPSLRIDMDDPNFLALFHDFQKGGGSSSRFHAYKYVAHSYTRLLLSRKEATINRFAYCVDLSRQTHFPRTSIPSLLLITREPKLAREHLEKYKRAEMKL
jgi:hypothetical protein